MVKKKLAFVFGVFCATVLLMAVQKPVFLAYYAAAVSYTHLTLPTIRLV